MGYRKKYAKKPRRKTYEQYKKKKMNKVKPFRSIVGTNVNAQVLNTKIKTPIHYYKDTINYQDIVGTGAAMTGLIQFDIGLLPRYAQLVSMYRQYKIQNIKVIWRLKTIELSDNQQHPHLLMRYNYDPTLAIGSVNENTMLRKANVISKQFIHNEPNGTTLEYTFKPCVMQALRVWNASNFFPSPKFNQWCDFTGTSTAELAHFGLVYWLSILPTDQSIDFDVQFTYCCRDLI